MNEPARADVSQAIRAAVVNGTFAPRQRLVEADLCAQFSASRFAVRAALADLSAQGLVEFERNRGARVREVSIAEAIEITEVRRLLEGMESARAAERASRTELAQLRGIVRDMNAAVARSELLVYSELNVALHRTIREIAGHGTATRILEQLRDQTVRHQFTLSLIPGRPTVSLPQHIAIVEAIVARDAAAAEQAMHAHLDSVIAALTAMAAAAER